MSKIKELKDTLLEELYSYVDNLDKDERDTILEDFDERLQELIAEVEMKTRKEKNKEIEKNSLKKITLWTNIRNCGDGSAANYWVLTEEDAYKDIEIELEEYDSGWTDDCIETIETFVGSETHQKAIENSKSINSQKK